MALTPDDTNSQLTTHFFREEYGKLVAIITRYLGQAHVETAEDIVQETLLKATEHWDIHGLPNNPKAWLYATAKNLALNVLKRRKYQLDYASQQLRQPHGEEGLEISDELIADSQLKMMFSCCHDTIPENSRIALILKILSGFSITEIANAFFSNNETINKRLVRGRKQLRKVTWELDSERQLDQRLDSVLKTIYLLFNEGYFPSHENQVIRFDLCLEAIRLAHLLNESPRIGYKTEVRALLALMYFNASRFKSRISKSGEIVDLKKQDRSKWDGDLIQQGIRYLDQTTEGDKVSKFAILATISANHCIASTYETTNWEHILALYDQLLSLEHSPIVALNRSVALAEVKGVPHAIDELVELSKSTDIQKYFLYHFTLAEFYRQNQEWKQAQKAYQSAKELAVNPRDQELLEKKLNLLVPNPPSQLS